MNQQRKVSIAETGVGLALLICLLVVIGYTALEYLGGGWRAPTVEIRPSVAAESDISASEADEQPHVLTVESRGPSGQAQRESPITELR